ncbi:thermonuclease [Ornithinimicrobium tianjinense]|uniref:Thermonuclease n=1 Tax=Ornithinimicrobium tianjinense TaxID=1195761 RepID=A0A917BJQ6_9MICO|nr:thermonuclease [Ornithinimicrobium tianjinense]
MTRKDLGCLLVLVALGIAVWLALRLTGTSLGDLRDRVLGGAGATDLETVTVRSVLDGDTVQVERPDGTTVRVRLMNIDAPETGYRTGAEPECLAEQARSHLGELLTRGTAVGLELGPDPRDRYGRTVALVWRGDVLVNAEMARAGLAVPLLVGANDLGYDAVLDAFDEARERGVGFFDPDLGCAEPLWLRPQG